MTTYANIGWQRLPYPTIPFTRLHVTPDEQSIVCWSIGSGSTPGYIQVFDPVAGAWSAPSSMPAGVAPSSFSPVSGGCVSFIDGSTVSPRFWVVPIGGGVAYTRSYYLYQVSASYFSLVPYQPGLTTPNTLWLSQFPDLSFAVFQNPNGLQGLLMGIRISTGKPALSLFPNCYGFSTFVKQWGTQPQTLGAGGSWPSMSKFFPRRVYWSNPGGIFQIIYANGQQYQDISNVVPPGLLRHTYQHVFRNDPLLSPPALNPKASLTPVIMTPQAFNTANMPTNTPFEAAVITAAQAANTILSSGSMVTFVNSGYPLASVIYAPFVRYGASGEFRLPVRVPVPAGFTSWYWSGLILRDRPIIIDNAGNMYALNVNYFDAGAHSVRNYVRNYWE